MRKLLCALAMMAGIAAIVPSQAEAAVSAAPVAHAMPAMLPAQALVAPSDSVSTGQDLLQPVQYWRERRRYREFRRYERARRYESRRRYYRRY